MSNSEGSTRSKKEYALKYAEWGWPVFPVFEPNDDGGCSCGDSDCNSPAKHPRISGGRNQATTDAAQIEAWWTQWPNANIGIATGEESGIWVLDIDDRHGGRDSLQELMCEFGELPETLKSETGGGGEHWVFIDANTNVRNKANVRSGIDVRGKGGYIVAPPSVHISGRQYQWNKNIFASELQLATAPHWLLNLGSHRQKIRDQSHQLPDRSEKA
ncbi:MAG: bifunctional DNA primase/polymerase [Bdellovibrionales bacterium]